MKAILAGVLVYVALLVATLIPSASARAQAEAAGFTAEQIDTAWQYTLERRLFMWAYSTLQLGFLLVLVATSLGRRLADRLLAWTRGRWLLAVLGMGAVCYF